MVDGPAAMGVRPFFFWVELRSDNPCQETVPSLKFQGSQEWPGLRLQADFTSGFADE